MQNTYAYPAILNYADDGISIEFPDLPGCLPCAFSTSEAIKNAKEAMGLHLYGMERDNEEIPEPTDISKIKLGKNDIPLLVDVYMPPIRERINTKLIKKTLSVPNWLNSQAEAAGINFSETLQRALKTELNIAD